MTHTPAQALAAIAVIAAATLMTRALPFILFPASKALPPFIDYINRMLPFAVIGMLVVYCLKDVKLAAFPYGAPEAIAVVFVAAVHRRWHNTLFSIGGGTALYLLLVNMNLGISF